jgi:hypothetical protein
VFEIVLCRLRYKLSLRNLLNSLIFLNPTRESLLTSCIIDFYLRPERPSLAVLILEVKRRFGEQNLLTPNYRTVRRRVEGLDSRRVIRKQEGVQESS